MCGERLYLGEELICIHCNVDLPRTMQWKKPQDNDLSNKIMGRANIAKAAAFLYYRKKSATTNIFLSFKSGKYPYAATFMGHAMAAEMSTDGLFEDIDCFVTVPADRKRKKKRGYDQSEILAEAMAEKLNIPVIRDVLKRKSGSLMQKRLGAMARAENAAQSYTVSANAARVAGLHCMLVDDIITTGSTIVSCANALLKIPGTRVSVISLGCTRL